MKFWAFHPWIFYPLAVLLGAGAIALSLMPQSWPREARPQAGIVENGEILLQGQAFDSPSASPEQEVFVARNWRGEAQALRIAVLPNQPAPTPAETGARILLTPETASLIDDKPVTLEVAYRSLEWNPSPILAASVQGIGPAEWVAHPTEAGEGVVRFDLPAQIAANAIGLRTINSDPNQNTGVEIISIRIMPRA